MYKFTIIILFIILFFYLINNILNKNNYEYFNNLLYNPIFFDKDNLTKILLENNDDYYNIFYKYDLYARNVNNIEEYKVNIQKSTVNFTQKQKDKIIKACNLINNKIKNINIDIYGFDKNKFNKIIFKFGAIKGKLYENGLPHTRDDIIILPIKKINNYSIEKLSKTICHEKVHIYQKKYKEDIQLYLKKNNIKILKKREEKDLIRANPDLDNFIYYDNNLVYSAKYNSETPVSVEDIIYNYDQSQSSEHPFEKMAIEIENII
jgi:hypothetical protein